MVSDNEMKSQMIQARQELSVWKSRAEKAEEELTDVRALLEKAKPALPETAPMTLDPATTAVLVLDLTNRCNDPSQVCSQIVGGVNNLVEKARKAGVLVIYTLIAGAKDTPQGGVWNGFNALPGEPVLAPDAYDKFDGGEIRGFLEKRGVKNVIVTGASSNFAVLYTSTTAARLYHYNVVIPVDGIIARTPYEGDYSVYQFTRLPGAAQYFSFTTLGGIEFKG
ncbi:MAG: isochorismatase family protein [Dehalococcoidia bacterium]|nr:isochorismatase family protein [Dehalococcoidia bacterium]